MRKVRTKVKAISNKYALWTAFYAFVLLAALLWAWPSYAAYTFHYGPKCNRHRIAASQTMQNSLKRIANMVGRDVVVHSCFRSQEDQNRLLRQRNCRPFGTRNCGSHTATRSYHTTQVAADMMLPTSQPKACQILNQVRAEYLGGRGGVGGYGMSGGMASAHFDLRPYRGTWNVCKRYVGGKDTVYRSPDVTRYRTERMGANRNAKPRQQYSFWNKQDEMYYEQSDGTYQFPGTRRGPASDQDWRNDPRNYNIILFEKREQEQLHK